MKAFLKKHRLFLLTFLFFTLAAAIFYLINTAPASSKLLEARQAMENGDTDAAYDAYIDVLKKFPSSEEAYVNLAKISEGRGDYASSSEFWMRAYAINPQDPVIREKGLRAMIASRADDVFISAYSVLPNKKDFDKEILYNYGLACIRKYLTPGIIEAMDILKNTVYADLLNCAMELNRGNSELAKRGYIKILNSENADEDQKNRARLGIAICSMLESDADAAEESLSQITGSEDPDISGDMLIMKAKIARARGEYEKDLEYALAAVQIQNSNSAILLETLELAYLSGRPDILDALQKAHNKSNKKNIVTLAYYFDALKAASGNDWKKAKANLDLSGIFTTREIAKWLELECAIRLKNSDAATRIVGEIDSSGMSEKLRIFFSKGLAEMLEDKSDDRSLRIALRRINPEDATYNALEMRDALNYKNYKKSLECAMTIMKTFPNDTGAFFGMEESLLALERPGQALQVAKERIKKFPASWDGFLFAARASHQLRDRSSARNFYMKAFATASSAMLPREEAAMYFLDEGFDKEFDTVIKSLTSESSLPNADSLGYAILSEKLKREGKIKEACDAMESAIKCSPSLSKLYSSLAKLHMQNGDPDKALEVLERGSKSAPSEDIRFQRALVLFNKNDNDSLNKAIAILDRLNDSITIERKNIFILKAEILMKLGKPDAAIIAARTAVRIEPESPDTIFCLGLILFKLGYYHEAVDNFDRAMFVTRNPKIKEYLLKALYGELSKCETIAECRVVLLRILKFNPDDKKAQKLLEEIGV